jgi:hypothetical protein
MVDAGAIQKTKRKRRGAHFFIGSPEIFTESWGPADGLDYSFEVGRGQKRPTSKKRKRGAE